MTSLRINNDDEEHLLIDSVENPLDGAIRKTHPDPVASSRRTLTFCLLLGINLLNYIDRYTIAGILPLLQDKNKSGFSSGLSDSQGGLLMTVFVVSYMIFSPLFGYLGDRMSRKLLIAVGILLWSIFTIGGSFSQNYAELMISRGLVGIGEASYATIAPTIIADLYGQKERALMLSIFFIAIPVGAALGFIVGGQVAAAFGSWRWALRVSPPLGVFFAIILFLFTKEPERGATEDHQHETEATSHGLRGMIKDWKSIIKVKSFVFITLGYTAVTFTSGALAQWAPTLIHRQSGGTSYEYSVSQASLYFGAITVVTGTLGTLSGSYLAKRLERYTPEADGIVCTVGMLFCVPFAAMAVACASYSGPLFWTLVFFAEFFLCLNWGPNAAILLYVIVPNKRASAESLQILFSHLFGDAFSPYLVGAVSDALVANHGLDKGNALMFAFFIPTVVSLLGALAYQLGSKYIHKDRQAATTVNPKATLD